MKSLLTQHFLRGAGRVTQAEWVSVLEYFDHRCAYCGVHDKMTVDHVIPLSAGGQNQVDNVVPACGSCNLVKGKSGPLALANRNFALRRA